MEKDIFFFLIHSSLLALNISKLISETLKYAYKLEVWEGVRCDTYDFPAHILSYKLRTTPGTVYKVSIISKCYDLQTLAELCNEWTYELEIFGFTTVFTEDY